MKQLILLMSYFLLLYIGSVNKDVTEQENKLSKSASTYLYRNFDFFLAKNGEKFRALHALSTRVRLQ